MDRKVFFEGEGGKMKKVILVAMVIFCQHAFAEGHDASRLYKEAKAQGFSDYSWLAELDYDYKRMGMKKLQSIKILVDMDCGAHYYAIQRFGRYVLFVPGDLRDSACSGRERVAVIPAQGFTFHRGQSIDRNSYYVFVGILKGESEDGFPTQVSVVRQVVVRAPARGR